ncbi:Tripartite tricarboxylate transporter family receptor [compost metagenome]
MFAPANTPEAITQPLIQALASVLAQPQTAEKLRNLGMDVEPTSLQAFRREIVEDTRTWTQLVAVSGATAD